MNLTVLNETLKTEGMHFYFCGPVPFMQYVAKQLLDIGVDKQFIRYECFGSHKVTQTFSFITKRIKHPRHEWRGLS